MSKSNVFVTDAGYKHALTIVRSLGRRELSIHCGSSSASPPISSFSRYAKKTLIYPDPKAFPDLFKVFIVKSSRKHDYRVVIPVGYNTTFALSRIKYEIEGAEIPVADFKSLDIAASKKKTVLLAEKLGVPTPHTVVPESSSDLESQAFSYPLVVKGVEESGFVRYSRNLQDLKRNLNEIYREQNEYPLIQEYIPGVGYGFFALFDNGEPRAVFMHRRIREYPLTGGPSTCAESVYEPKLLDYGLKLLKALNWHGVAMVEFRRDLRDSKFKLMEINPKFWGSLDLAIASGVDFPFLLYKMAVEGEKKQVFGYRIGVKFMWPFPDDLLRVIDMPSKTKSFICDLFDPRVVKNIDFNDLSPNAVQLAGATHLLIRKLVENI